jgi:hypothetical protein
MLAVVSAVVAFDRWPGSTVQAPAQTLLLEDKAPAIRVSATSTAPSATPVARPAARVPAVAVVPRPTFNGGGVAGQRFTAPATGAPAPAASPLPAVPKPPEVPQVPTPDNVIDSISNPGTTAGQIADGTQMVTDQAGISVGKVSPDVGNTVAVAGQQVSETIREIPLPNGILPGH